MKSRILKYMNDADIAGNKACKAASSDDGLALVHAISALAHVIAACGTNGQLEHMWHREWVLRANDRKKRKRI